MTRFDPLAHRAYVSCRTPIDLIADISSNAKAAYGRPSLFHTPVAFSRYFHVNSHRGAPCRRTMLGARFRHRLDLDNVIEQDEQDMPAEGYGAAVGKLQVGVLFR